MKASADHDLQVSVCAQLLLNARVSLCGSSTGLLSAPLGRWQLRRSMNSAVRMQLTDKRRICPATNAASTHILIKTSLSYRACPTFAASIIEHLDPRKGNEAAIIKEITAQTNVVRSTPRARHRSKENLMARGLDHWRAALLDSANRPPAEQSSTRRVGSIHRRRMFFRFGLMVLTQGQASAGSYCHRWLRAALADEAVQESKMQATQAERIGDDRHG